MISVQLCLQTLRTLSYGNSGVHVQDQSIETIPVVQAPVDVVPSDATPVVQALVDGISIDAIPVVQALVHNVDEVCVFERRSHALLVRELLVHLLCGVRSVELGA